MQFGRFELDIRRGELHKQGHRIRLQEQPFQILRMLLESPGEVVSREEIRNRLWPDNTVVGFDHSINAAVKRLRDALRDSAEKPRYIETVARRGYRFIGELKPVETSVPVAETVASPSPEPAAPALPEPAPSPPRPALPWRILVSTVLAAMILLIWAGARYYRHGAQPLVGSTLQPLMRLDLDLGSEPPPSPESGVDALLSPDGARLVHLSQSKLFTRRLDQAAATELPGTDGARAPFFSPDGQWVGFFADSWMKKASVATGQVIPVCEAALGNGASWGEDGYIVHGFSIQGLSRVPSTGGTPSRLTQLRQSEFIHRWPQVLPGSKAVLFTAYGSMTGLDGASIEAVSLGDGHRKTLVRGGTWGRYLASGHLVYVNKGTLYAVPFDPDRLEVHGGPTPVLDEVAYDSAWGAAQIDFSRTGSLVYRSSKAAEGLATIQSLDSSGNSKALVPVPGNYLSPTVSADGRRLALISAGDIWVYELGNGRMTRLTFGGGYGNPLWTVDGRYLVFRAGGRGIFWTRVDGAGQTQALTASDTQQIRWSFTGDGKRMAFVEPNSASRAVIWTVSVESSGSGLRAGKPEIFLQAPFNARAPMFSPDGRWIAYASNESGTNVLWVIAFPDKHGKQQILAGAGYPAWSRTGHELFLWKFAQGHPQLMAASYQERGDSFVAEEPPVWTKNRLIHFSTTRTYDPMPDGKHVVALMQAEAAEERHDRVIFLLNFFDELRRRVPSNGN